MNQDQINDFNRRDFLKGGSLATLMTMLGGVELFAQTNTPPAAHAAYAGPKLKLAVIGLGTWGRDLLDTLAVLDPVEVAAICDIYPRAIAMRAKLAPKALQTGDYKTLLDNKDIQAVIVATPTHQHKEIVLAALQAGKHVYCEAPLAHSIEDARAIALAAKAAKHTVFQAGLQMRAEPQRQFVVPFIRSGACGQWAMVRAQWHKKDSWRAASPSPEREKQLNWRINRETSPGLLGECGIHSIDQATWLLNAQPKAVSGFGSIAFWKDDRDVPDTVQALFEFPGGVTMHYDATLANSFDGQYDMFYGSDSAVMLRENNGESKAWLFKEVDSPNLGWEVYARKDVFYKDTGIALVANASKAVVATGQPEDPHKKTTLYAALQTFVLNAADIVNARENYITSFGTDDPNGLNEQLNAVQRRPACGFLDAYRATVTALKANEAILKRERIVLQPEWYELT